MSYSPEQKELLDAIQIMIDNTLNAQTTKIYSCYISDVGNEKHCTVVLNGKTQSVQYYGDTPIVTQHYKLFVPFGNMSQAFIITGGGNGSSGTDDYSQLINKPSVNSVTLTGNKTSTDLGLYGTGNEPDYPVDSVNGKTGAVVLTSGDIGAVPTSRTVNGKALSSNIVLTSTDVGALPDSTIIPTQTSQLTNNSGFITSAQAPVQSVNGKTGAVILNTDDVQPTTTRRYVPAIPAINPEVSFLNGNGTFAPIAVSGSVGFGNVFLSDINSSIATYKTLNYISDVVSVEKSVTCTSASDVLSAVYLAEAQIDTNVIDAGIWNSSFYMKVSHAGGGDSQIKIVCFLRHANGTETDLFTRYTSNIVATEYDTYHTETNRQQFSCALTDRLGLRIYGHTTRTSSTTITYQIGRANGSFINTPLALRHTQLRDLNGNPDYQHITTAQVAQIGTNTANIASLQSGKLNTNGDGSNVTATFIESSTSDNIASGSTLSVLFGKIQKAISNLIAHISNLANPHNVTKSQVGLGSVDNVRQYSASNPPPYPVTSVNGKTGTAVLTQDDVGSGTTYVQTQNNYTTTEKTKLSGIATGAQVNVIESVKRNGTALAITSKAVDITVPTKTSEITNDSGFITSAEVPVQSFNGRVGAVVPASGDYTAAQITGLQSAISTNTDVAANTAKRHDPVTLGTANGLSLSGQQVSLALATTSVAGAMSAADKTKLNGVATGANNYTLPVATASVLGGVKSGTDISVDSSGNVTVSNANKLNSQDGAYYLNRSNHTGTQLASTISDFVASVRATVLTGLSTATNAVITATDTVLTALGKLQAQITAHISNKSNPHEVTVSQIGAVPTTRTVNSKPLSGDVTLTASDVGALPSATIIPTKTSELTNDSKFLPVTQTAPTNGQIVAYDGTKWVNQNPATYSQQQANWDETDSGSVQFIQNKPTALSEFSNDAGFITSSQAPVQSVNGATGVVTITNITGNAATATKATQDGNGSTITSTYAKLASPTLTGTPKAPTATAGTNTTQIATTAFVTTAVTNAGGNVTYLSATAPTSPKTGDTWYQIL